MSYSTYEDERQMVQEISEQAKADEEFDLEYDLCQEAHNSMMKIVNNSLNPWLLNTCTPTDIMNLVETGEFQLPSYVLNRTKSKQDNCIGYIEPIDITNCEQIDHSDGWVTITDSKLKSQREKKLARIQKERKEKKMIQKRKEELRKKHQANKHNWTLTREQRGLPKIQPKPKESKPKRRKNRRRGGFRVNKTAITYNPNEVKQEEKSKRKFEIRRVSHKYE